jgi:biopolymer transport protein ExbD
MRRFSQRSALVTLSEINITPLLDLAFVLLIIFVITTPMLEQGLDVNLPVGGSPDTRRIEKQDIRTVEVNHQGWCMLNRQYMNLDQIAAQLAAEARRNPRLIVDIRGDEDTRWKYMFALIDRLTKAGVENVTFMAKPPPR